MRYYGNTLEDLMVAFGLNPGNRDDWNEFKIFWNHLTSIEKTQYRYAML